MPSHAIWRIDTSQTPENQPVPTLKVHRMTSHLVGLKIQKHGFIQLILQIGGVVVASTK
jgi:hypothetical protein